MNLCFLSFRSTRFLQCRMVQILLRGFIKSSLICRYGVNSVIFEFLLDSSRFVNLSVVSVCTVWTQAEGLGTAGCLTDVLTDQPGDCQVSCLKPLISRVAVWTFEMF